MIVIGYDATHANINHLPKGHQAAGYTTGSPDIKWTPADWAAHPGAIRIDQDPVGSDFTADVLDVERGAATPAHTPGWAKLALAAYSTAKRPGQRQPAIYTSASQVTPVVNALIAAGVKTGVGLWVANWNLTETAAATDVLAASGPFPIVAVQFTDSPGFYDIDVFSSAWLTTVSKIVPPHAGPYRHVTDGTKTLAELAAMRSETVAQLVINTAKNYTPADGVQAETALEHHTLPAGVPWYTVNP